MIQASFTHFTYSNFILSTMKQSSLLLVLLCLTSAVYTQKNATKSSQDSMLTTTLKAPSINVLFIGVDNGINFTSYSFGLHVGYKFRNKFQATVGAGIPLLTRYSNWSSNGLNDLRITADFAYLLPVTQNEVEFPVNLVVNYYTAKTLNTPTFPIKAIDAYVCSGFQTNKDRRLQFYHQFGLGFAYDFKALSTLPTTYKREAHFAAMMRFGVRWRFIQY